MDYGDSYSANAKFYEKPDGSIFGAFALTEETQTVLPKSPQAAYKIDENVNISEWRMVFVSTTEKRVIGDSEYFAALIKLEQYIIDSDEDYLLIKALSFEEIQSLI